MSRRRGYCAVAVVALLLASTAAWAQSQPVVHGPSGYPALITVPTAQMPPAGTIGVGVSAAPPYNTLYLSGQPTRWLHFGARYIAITNRRYDDDPANGQSFKDKSFDMVVRLLEQDRWWPAVVVGLNDFGGTGLFSSEYLVATQRHHDWSFTLGLGFGRFGTQGDLRNPFAEMGLRDDRRDLLAPAEEQGGVPGVDEWFAGRNASIMAGIEWAPRDRPWSFQLELDGNDYSAEPAELRLAQGGGLEQFDERIEQRSRINFGLRYKRPGSSWFAGLAFVRGETVVGQIGIAPQLGRDRSRVQEAGPPAARHLGWPGQRATVPEVDSTAGMRDWVEALADRGVYAHAVDLDAPRGTLTLWQSNTVSSESLDVLRTASRETLARMPEPVERLQMVEVNGGLDAIALSIDRQTMDAEARGDIDLDTLRASVGIASLPATPRARAQYPQLLEYPVWSYGINPGLRMNIGGIDGFLIGQLVAKPFATLQLTSRLSMTTVLAINIAGNTEELEQRDTSTRLPPVRSLLETYQTTSDDVWLDQWELNYLFPIARDWFGRVSGGIFEEMFGGVAAEVLYRPLHSRFALGLDVNYVKQRDFDQRLEFLDYEVATGHLSAYYRTPLEGVVMKASVGRYLARDVGATLDIAREFRNGVVLGAFATKTNVSAEDFGEGSFDKGIYLRIPMSVFYPGVDKGTASFNYRFLTRDGGQKVGNGRSLYDAVGHFTAEQVLED
ncbi:MAG: YjbH domain-containing protein [Sinimarinibacterium flocculans]|uniref:YjbH domain-containing protein n=1 Tax=Sinimarinibacterium flocculans TaxID=985250 RepID=UPI003C604309